jgi:hypothetical protein
MPFFGFLVVAALVGSVTVVGAAKLPQRLHGVALALVGASAVMIVNTAAHVRFYADDSYIALRYSRNLADGLGPVWNPGERVEGYTSFSWMAILAGMHRIGFDLVDATYVLSYISMFAVFLLLWRIWDLWASESSDAVIGNPAVLAVVLLAVGLSSAVSVWGFSGLETPLAAALLTGGMYRYFVERRTGAFPFSSLLFAAGAMTRPELVLIGGLAGLWIASEAFLGEDKSALQRAGIWIAIFVASYGAYFIWRYSYYGYVFPNTYYAKVGSNRDTIQRGIEYVRNQAAPYLFLPLIVGAAAMIFDKASHIRRDAMFTVTIVAAWLFAIALEGGDAFPDGRFLMPVIPILFLAGTVGLAGVLSRALPDRRHFVAVAGVACVLAGLALAQTSVDRLRYIERIFSGDRRDAAYLLRERLPSDFTVAVFAAGSTPYYSEMRSLDMLGLTDETIAHTDVPNQGEGVSGHEKYNINYVLNEAKPEVILISGYGPEVHNRVYVETHPGAFPVPGHTALINDPRTWQLYQMSALRDGDRWFNFLLRKDALASFQPDWTEGQGSPPANVDQTP